MDWGIIIITIIITMDGVTTITLDGATTIIMDGVIIITAGKMNHPITIAIMDGIAIIIQTTHGEIILIIITQMMDGEIIFRKSQITTTLHLIIQIINLIITVMTVGVIILITKTTITIT
jgi:hypothetical protein